MTAPDLPVSSSGGPPGPPVADAPATRPVLDSERVHHGVIWDVVRDTVDLGDPEPVRREYVQHPGAVAVIALDDEDRVLLLRQYRHPVRQELWEPPAGLLDVPGEDLQMAAARELAEEADLVAASWWLLVDCFTTPGGSDETLRVFLARDLTPVAEDARYERVAEERDIVVRWVPLTEAVDAVLAGRVRNLSAVAGILAVEVSRSRGWADLRPAS